MIRIRRRAVRLSVAILLVLPVLSGCLVRGADGSSYLALDWTYTPLQADFPGIASDIYVPGTYYAHEEGDFFAYYVAWDGSYHEFIYTIEVNPGDYGLPFSYGLDGPDRYYVMELHARGPELWYVDDISSRAVNRSSEPEGLPAGRIDADPSRFDLEHPRPYVRELEGDGWRVRIEGRRYPPRL